MGAVVRIRPSGKSLQGAEISQDFSNLDRNDSLEELFRGPATGSGQPGQLAGSGWAGGNPGQEARGYD